LAIHDSTKPLIGLNSTGTSDIFSVTLVSGIFCEFALIVINIPAAANITIPIITNTVTWAFLFFILTHLIFFGLSLSRTVFVP
jgi:hypothetical protein